MLKTIFFVLAVLCFVLAGFNAQVNTAAVKTNIQWHWLAAACLTVALWLA